MSTKRTKYRCGLHGAYKPDFYRQIDGHECPRILCLKCEKASYQANATERPKNVPYFYKEKLAVILQEAHNGSAVWKFHPPVVYPKWSFARDLKPIIPEGALTSEQIMENMIKLLPEINGETEIN